MAAIPKYRLRSNREKQVFAWATLRSRDSWKKAAQERRKEIHVLKVRVADVSGSRETWKAKCDEANQKLIEAERRIQELEDELVRRNAENAQFMPAVSAPESKKS